MMIRIGAMAFILWLLSSTTTLAESNASDVVPPAKVSNTVDAKDSSTALNRNDAVIASITIFVLSVFVGFEIITKVPPTLHTPLMSGSNAISGITIVGALLSAGIGETNLAAVLGMLAVITATVNVVGGFLVTHRMLSMFRKK